VSTTIPALWAQAERAAPDKTALVAGGRRLTYGEVGRAARRLAGGLAASWGLGPGEVVALLAPNCPEFVVAYLAVVGSGRVVQPIDERLTPGEIAAVLADSGVRALIVHQALWPRYAAACARAGAVPRVLGIGVTAPGVETFERWVDAAAAETAERAVAPGDIAELMYTSGTATSPKAVLRSHANVAAAAGNAIRGFGYRADDVIAIAMPLSHSSGLTSQMLPLLALGGRLVLVDRFEVKALLATVRAEGVTCMRAVPAMLRSLLATPEFAATALPSLRLLVNSSAAIDPETYRTLKRRFAAIEVMNSYGLTEASTCTVLPDAMALERPDSIGVPIDGVEMQLVDERGRVVDGPGEGEIRVRGPHVFVGYRNQPQATAAALVDGWLCTGDLAARDADGFYYLRGRRDDVINCAGRKVLPLEVEHCILELPEVAEVAVVAAPHRVLGQVVKALVVGRDGARVDAKRVINHCARRLASHKIPFFVQAVAALPRNSVGKTVRRELAAVVTVAGLPSGHSER
jgi:acyl-CoA synthetase (AMP-forming)/AMP-acid ligase II